MARPTVEVTTCGQYVPRQTTGFLTADLDCTGFTGWPAGAAVGLAGGARLELRGSTVSENGQDGVVTAKAEYHGAVSLRDSTVTGNGVGGDCGTFPCVDLLSGSLPRLRGASTCERSGGSPGGLGCPGNSWCACSLD